MGIESIPVLACFNIGKVSLGQKGTPVNAAVQHFYFFPFEFFPQFLTKKMAPAQNILIGSGYSCSKSITVSQARNAQGDGPSGNGKNKIYDMGRIVKTVRMMPSGPADNSYRPPHPGVTLSENIRILFNRDYIIFRPGNKQQRNSGFSHAAHIVHGVTLIGQSLLFIKTVGAQAFVPVIRRTFALAPAGRPAFEITDGGIHINASHAQRILLRPVKRIKASTAQSKQHRFSGKTAFIHQIPVKLIHHIHGLGRTVKVFHADKYRRITALYQFEICYRLIIKKLRPPYPQLFFSRNNSLVGKDDECPAAAHGKLLP